MIVPVNVLFYIGILRLRTAVVVWFSVETACTVAFAHVRAHQFVALTTASTAMVAHLATSTANHLQDGVWCWLYGHPLDG